MAPVFNWTGKNSKNMNQRLEMWLGCLETKKFHDPTVCPQAAYIYLVSCKRSSMTPSSTCVYLLTLVPHQVLLDSAPSLVLPTLWKGLELRPLSEERRELLSSFLTDSMLCSLFSLLMRTILLPLSADWHSLHLHACWGKCQPSPELPYLPG